MTNERILTQKFTDVKGISVNSICHRCHSKQKVKVGNIRITKQDGAPSGSVAKWKLCETCSQEGWEPIEATISQFKKSAIVMYKNASNGKTKSHQVYHADMSMERDILDQASAKKSDIMH